MAFELQLAIHEEAPCIWQKAYWMARNGPQQNLRGYFRKSREQPVRNWHAFLVTDRPCSERDSSVSRRSQPGTGRTADWFPGRGAPLDSLQKQDEVLSVPHAWLHRLITTLRRLFRALMAGHGHHDEFEPGLEQTPIRLDQFSFVARRRQQLGGCQAGCPGLRSLPPARLPSAGCVHSQFFTVHAASC